MRIHNNDLQDALKRIKPIVSGKVYLPILNHVLIESTPSGAVYLYATNLDTGVRIQLNASLDLDIETEFRRALPYEALNSFSNSLDATDSIRIRKPIDEHSYAYIMESVSGSASTRIQTIPAEDFPTFDFYHTPEGHDTGTGENTDINILAGILYCASADDSRFNLNGIYLDSKTNLLVATDGHRLATRTIPQVFNQLQTPVIIPRSGIKHLEVFFKGTSGYIQGYVTAKRIMISNLSRTMVWTCRLMDGEYPEYNKVIPVDLKETCTLPAKETRKFLKGLNISKKEYEKNKGVTIKSNCSGINIFRKDSEGNTTTGNFKGTFPEDFEIILNRNYLVELIDHTDNLTLLRQSGCSSGGPVAIKSFNGNLDILMPMRK